MPLLAYSALQPVTKRVKAMKLRLVVPIIMAVLMASCAPAPPLINQDWLDDTSLLTGEPCEAPCWRNIVPGETSWEAALALIEADDTLGAVNEPDVDDESQQVNFTYSPSGDFGDRLQCCTLIAEDGETISHILLFFAPQMSIGEVIEEFGDPVYAEGGAYSPEQTWVTMVFPDVPMLVYVQGETFEQGALTQSNTAFGALYMTDAELDKLLQVEDLYEWDGYGMFAELFDGAYDLTAVPDAETE